ncbi:MAG: dUTP diphosphatase [Oscillospiraceae bacterium]|nr:dUTP diphosphatase [Oscillospiraceae bacterium]
MMSNKNENQVLKFIKISKNAHVPTRGTSYSAGMDLYACEETDVIINPSEIKKISCGIAIEIPSKNYAAFIFSRSGLGVNHGIAMANGVGVIDSDYRGEIFVGLCNVSNKPYTVHHNDRIAQMIIIETKYFPLVECLSLSKTSRGSDGFGSTGK